MEQAVRVTIAAPISGVLIGNARRAYERCIRERLDDKVFVTDDNNFSRYALDAIILSVAALEAFLNEAALNPVALGIRRADAALQALEELEIRRKYVLVPLVLWGTTFQCSRQPFQDFDCLVRVRNDLIHYKMPFYPSGHGPKYLRHLETNKLLLESDGPSRFGWVENLSSAKVALWAHNTACRMAKELMVMADAVGRAWGDLAENFREIPPDYWKTIAEGST